VKAVARWWKEKSVVKAEVKKEEDVVEYVIAHDGLQVDAIMADDSKEVVLKAVRYDLMD
jgi:hypothetical protein